MSSQKLDGSGSGGTTQATDDPDVGGGSSSLKNHLTDNFLGPKNRIQWLELAGAILSGAVTAVATGYVRITTSLGVVVDEGLQPIEDAARNGGADVVGAIANAAEVWGVMDVGPASLIVNGVAILIVLFAFAWVISNV